MCTDLQDGLEHLIHEQEDNDEDAAQRGDPRQPDPHAVSVTPRGSLPPVHSGPTSHDEIDSTPIRGSGTHATGRRGATCECALWAGLHGRRQRAGGYQGPIASRIVAATALGLASSVLNARFTPGSAAWDAARAPAASRRRWRPVHSGGSRRLMRSLSTRRWSVESHQEALVRVDSVEQVAAGSPESRRSPRRAAARTRALRRSGRAPAGGRRPRRRQAPGLTRASASSSIAAKRTSSSVEGP